MMTSLMTCHLDEDNTSTDEDYISVDDGSIAGADSNEGINEDDNGTSNNTANGGDDDNTNNSATEENNNGQVDNNYPSYDVDEDIRENPSHIIKY